MKFLKFWFPILIYCCIIFRLSSIENVQFPSSLPNIDKLIHGIEYGILGALFSRALRASNSKASLPLVFTITVFFVMFYGITDEFHQSFVPGRCMDLHDLMADTIGGAIGSLIYLSWRKTTSNSKG